MSLVPHLQALLGAHAVLTAEAEIAAHATDWRGRYRGNASCVALPASTEQVAAVVRACAEHGVPIVAQGGNTSLCEGAVPRSGEPPSVVINLQRMRRVRSIDVANNSIEVEAGCVLAQVQQAAAEHGRLYPVSLGAEGSCQIGGNIATNAGGTGVLRYGNTRENVLGLEAVLPDGRIWDGLYRPAQEQHRLRPQAPVHRQRRHAGRDHRGDAEAASRCRARTRSPGWHSHRRRRRCRCSAASSNAAAACSRPSR